MSGNNKKILYHSALVLLIFALGFAASVLLDSEFTRYVIDLAVTEFNDKMLYHCSTIQSYPNAWHYFLLPEGWYIQFYTKGLSLNKAFAALFNALFNALFQPLFLCIFTPEVILNYLLFPFFIYGCIKYFKKVSLMILLFFAAYIYIGMNGSIVEPLIRHRLSCALIYLLISLAGLERWIVKRL